MDKLAQRLNQSEKLTASVLKRNEKSRSDDKVLLMEVWEMQGLHLTKAQKDIFMKCLSAETITRARRSIQELGFYRDIQRYEQRKLIAEEKRVAFRNR